MKVLLKTSIILMILIMEVKVKLTKLCKEMPKVQCIKQNIKRMRRLGMR